MKNKKQNIAKLITFENVILYATVFLCGNKQRERHTISGTTQLSPTMRQTIVKKVSGCEKKAPSNRPLLGDHHCNVVVEHFCVFCAFCNSIDQNQDGWPASTSIVIDIINQLAMYESSTCVIAANTEFHSEFVIIQIESIAFRIYFVSTYVFFSSSSQ